MTPNRKGSVTHLHFIVWAAQDKLANGTYTDVTHLDLIASDEAQAVERAKKLAPGRRLYWVNDILEHHPHHEGAPAH